MSSRHRGVALAALAALTLVFSGCAADDASPASPVPVDSSVRSDAERLVGRHIEDGIAWAEERGIEWRLTVIGDRVVDADTPARDDRISFQTDSDIIVAVEWS